MIIQVDEEGQKALQSICGAAIETIGKRILPLAATILQNIKPLPPQGEPKKEDEEE